MTMLSEMIYLSVCVDDGAEQFPGAAAPVHAHHAQDLEEPQSSQGRRSEHLARRPHAQHHHRCQYCGHIC